MKKYIIGFVAYLLIGCSPVVVEESPLGYSFMPKYLDIDSIHLNLPEQPDTLVSENAIDFSPKFIEGGLLISDAGDSSILLPGVLISERSSVRYIYYEAGYRRLLVESSYLKKLTKEYYEKSLEAEKLYQKEIERLRIQSKRSWLEKNMGYIGFAAGIAVMAIQQILVVKVLD